MEKRFCDSCLDEITGAVYWTLKGFEHLCHRCYDRLKKEAR